MEENSEQVRYAVYITPKRGVLDPQGQAALQALKALGYGEVDDVRIGKYIILSLKGDGAKEERVREMCEKLLANPIIEDYEVSME